MRTSLSPRDRRRCVPFGVFAVLAVSGLIAFGGGHGSTASWASGLVLVTAAVLSAPTVHYVSDEQVFTWGLVEVAVGLASAVPRERWGLVPLAVGIIAGFAYKMARQPVRACLNAAMYIAAASVGLAAASAVHAHDGLVGIGVGAAVASLVTSAVTYILATCALAYINESPLRAEAARYRKPDVIHATVCATLATALGMLASSDLKAAAAAVVVAALLLPQSTARLRAKADASQLRAALDGVADLMRAADPAAAEEVLLRLARQLTGIGELALSTSSDPVVAQHAEPAFATAEASSMFVLGAAPADVARRPLHQPAERVLDRLAAVAGAALDATRRGQTWRNLAELDPLTGLLNRRAFIEALDQHFADDSLARPCAVVFIDLDGFKAVNDQHGHEAGDLLLSDVASELLRITRRGDVCARLGGDEFCMLLIEDTTRIAGDSVSARIIEAVSEVARRQGRPVSASIGVARFPQDARSGSALLQLADERMYEYKRATRSPAHSPSPAANPVTFNL